MHGQKGSPYDLRDDIAQMELILPYEFEDKQAKMK